MKQFLRGQGSVLLLNVCFVALLALFAFNRGLGDPMMSIVMPLLIVTSAALVYTAYFKGDMLIAAAACLLLEVGQMLQVLINKGVPSMTEGLLFACPVAGAAGILLICLLKRLDYGNRKVAVIALSVTAGGILLLSLMLLAFGKNISGTKAWIAIGGLSLQLTEFFKPLYLLFHAVLWNTKLRPRVRFCLSAGLTAICAALLLVINELGTLMVILLMWILLTFLYSDRLIDTAVAAGATVVGICGGFAALSALHARVVRLSSMGETPGKLLLKTANIYDKLAKRLLIFTDLNSFSSTDQAVIARRMIIKGGLLGSTDNVWIPVESSDYAFVGLLLRCGIAFGVVVFFLYVAILIHSLLFACRTQDRFEFIIFTGTALSLILPAFANILGTTNFSIMTGIALPFLSHGGTNMLLTMFNIMLLLWGSCEQRPRLIDRLTASRRQTESHRRRHAGR